jgi:hypothetical protein
LNGVSGCYTYDGSSQTSPNAVVTGVPILYSNCQECNSVSPTPTPTSTPTPTPSMM